MENTSQVGYFFMLCICCLTVSCAIGTCPKECTECETNLAGDLINATCINIQIQTLPDTVQTLHLSNATSRRTLPLGRFFPFLLQNKRELCKLTINNYGIQEIFQSAFASCSKLTELNLADNNLTALTGTDFKDLTNLRTLDVHRNEIANIDALTFQGLSQLQMIDLRHNLLTEFDPRTFSNLTSLLRLELRHNNIMTILDKEISGTSLSWISLNENNLTTIPTNFLVSASNKNLEVNMANNKVTAINNGDLANVVLKTLTLTGNGLSLVQPDALQNTFIQMLDLQQNRLVHLFQSLENHLNQSMILLLANNPWSCDCDIQWMARIIDIKLQNPSCASPDLLNGQYIANIDPAVLCTNFSFPVPSQAFAVPARQDHAVTPALMPHKSTTDSYLHAEKSMGDNTDTATAIGAGVAVGVILLILLIILVVCLTLPRVKVAPDHRMQCRRPDENFNSHLVRAYEPV